MKFHSKRDYSIGAILWGLPVLNLIFLIPFFWYYNQSFTLSRDQFIALAVLGVLSAILFHIWFNTYYLVEDKRLKYKAGFFGGSLDIDSIESIKHSDYMLSGNRPAMSLDGLLIRYKGNRKIFISPEDETGFIKELQMTNSDLVIG